MKKNYMQRRWRWKDNGSEYFFYTCARPGRTSQEESKRAPVSDADVGDWLSRLPGPNTAIVSLLGCKPDGTSEYRFYSFYGGFDTPEDRPGRKSFREWLDQWEGSAIELREHPTTDFQRVPHDVLRTTANSIAGLLRQGYTVVLVDSGGCTRTGQVCEYMQAIEDSSKL